MCGLSGYYSKTKTKFNKNLLKKILHHRGPDNFQTYEHNGTIYNLMAFNRLSILDLNERSNQPFKYKNLILCFNGEIYNFKKLKIKLRAIKIKLNTSSDTEVLIKYIYHFGLNKTLKDIQGMWAFSLYNKINEKLILCRDYFGEKPLFYINRKNNFFYGSEIPVLEFYNKKKLKIDFDYLKKYLFFEYRALNSNDLTLYKNVKELNPGTYIEINQKFKIKEVIYFKPKNINKEINYNNYIRKLKTSLTKNVKNCLISDRPIALSLSGGIDSTGLASIIKKRLNKNIAAFTIFSNDKNYDEFRQVKITVKKLKLKHYWIHINKKDFLKNLKKIISRRNSPLPTLTSYIQWLMYREISKKKFKVVLSGNGADEIFSGYYDHFLAQLNDLRGKLFRKKFKSWKDKIYPIIRNENFKDYLFYKKNYNKILLGPNLSKIFGKKKYLLTLRNEKIYKSLLKNRMYNELRYESLPVILREDDLNAMYFSLENRSPYLNHILVKDLNSLHCKYFIRDGFAKIILRDTLKGLAPRHILSNYEKIGFNISLNKIIDFNSKNVQNLLKANSKIYKIIDKKKILNLINNQEKINRYQNFLFKFINTKILLDNHQ